MRRSSVTQALALGAVLAVLAGCGTGSSDTTSSSPSASAGAATTITWWHNSNTDPGKSYYEQVARTYEAAHPGVTVQISAMQHEDMLTKLDAAFQGGDAPDVYMERGGGELAAHVQAGLVKDISAPAADVISQLGGSVAGWQVEGKTYALPFSVGVVGFWYNKTLFERAGISSPPATLDELLADTKTLRDKGIEPISVGAGDKWPAAHYWYYLSLRECPQQVLQDAVKSLDFSNPCFVSAGQELEKVIKADPFNRGFLSTPAQSGPTSASGLLATGKVAMEMQGHWEPGVMQGLTADKKGLGDKLGWFPFPSVTGGQGDPAAALGGGDAWAVSKDAPDAAVDFVKYLLSEEVQKGFAERDMGLPTLPTASGAVKDPALAGLLKVRNQAPYVQLYFDTAFGQAVGGAMNDEIALMFAGKAGPQDVVQKTQAAADAAK